MKCPNCNHEFKMEFPETVEFYCGHCNIRTTMLMRKNDKRHLICGCGREMKVLPPPTGLMNYLISSDSILPV